MTWQRLRSGCFIFVSILLTSQIALAEHRVSVMRVTPVKSTVTLKVSAQVDAKLDSYSGASIHSYALSVQIPRGVTVASSVGARVNVSLPVVRNRETKAEVLGIENEKVKLRLSNQVQQLEGQTLTVEIPLKNNGLFLLPSHAVYSPRGLNPQVFILTEDQTTRAMPVTILQASDDGRILIASPNLLNATVVVKGLENLIIGKPVQVIGNEEVKHD